MTNKLEKIQPIDKAKLDHTRYFEALIEAAANNGLIDAGDMRRQCLKLASKLAQRLTFGASSSIKEETAKGLLKSIFYCLSRRLKTMETGGALGALRDGVEHVWQEGRELTYGDVKRAQGVLALLRASSVNTENMAYNDTLGEGLEAFFGAYDPLFAAHETPGMIDYFLCIELPKLAGAEFMLAYIERLSLENSFCARFGGSVEALLRSADPYWRELNVNIFELVLTNAIGRVLCGRDVFGLDISKEDRQRLNKALAPMSARRLKAELCMASQRVCAQTGASEALAAYALAAAGRLSARVHFALQTDALDGTFIEFKEEKQKTRFEDAPSMDDEAFRALTDEIRCCRHTSDKLELLKSIRSLRDLEDMLGASCLQAEEYAAVFGTLDDNVLALLYARIPEDTLHVTKAESEWHSSLAEYLGSTGKTQSIREAAQKIERE